MMGFQGIQVKPYTPTFYAHGTHIIKKAFIKLMLTWIQIDRKCSDGLKCMSDLALNNTEAVKPQLKYVHQ